MKTIEMSRIFALDSRLRRSPKTSADGSSDAAIRNCASPSARLSPPRLVTSVTRKPLIGMRPIMPKKQAMSMSVKVRLPRRICRAEWPSAAPFCGCGRSCAGMDGNSSRHMSITSCSAQCASSAVCIPKRAVKSPVATQSSA